MAVPIVENWSKISGTVSNLQPSDEVKGFTVVEIDVRKVESVEGFPNLLSGKVGSGLQVHMPDDLIRVLNITRGDRVVCQVRQGGPKRFFVHREHIIIER